MSRSESIRTVSSDYHCSDSIFWKGNFSPAELAACMSIIEAPLQIPGGRHASYLRVHSDEERH